MVKLWFSCIVLAQGLHTECWTQVPASSKETDKGIDRIEFASVVIADSLSKQFLFKNAKNWVMLLNHHDEKTSITLEDSIGGRVFGKSLFFVYSQTGILKKVSGTINYNLSIEVKDNKYRYRFSDFVFHYFKQDRYYNMVETGKTKPLEDTEASGWQKLWAQHKSTTYLKIHDQINAMKIKMVEKQRIAAEEKVEIEW